MAYADVLRRRSFGETMRRDAWWVQPLVVFLAFSAFIVYATWAAFQGAHYRSGSLLSSPPCAQGRSCERLALQPTRAAWDAREPQDDKRAG